MDGGGKDLTRLALGGGIHPFSKMPAPSAWSLLPWFVLHRPAVPIQERVGLSESPVGCLMFGRRGDSHVTSLTRPASKFANGTNVFSPTGAGLSLPPVPPPAATAGHRDQHPPGGQGSWSCIPGQRGSDPPGSLMPPCALLSPLSEGLACTGGVWTAGLPSGFRSGWPLGEPGRSR